LEESFGGRKIIFVKSMLATKVMIFKIFSQKMAEICIFFTQNTTKLCNVNKEKNSIFFAENLQKSPKLVIKILTPELQAIRQQFQHQEPVYSL
jgi:hypothetical protein